jgi:hypothetical protein
VLEFLGSRNGGLQRGKLIVFKRGPETLDEPVAAN